MITRERFENQILPVTLKHEGGWVNIAQDRGGETYRGISRRANPNWPGWAMLDRHRPLTRGDIVNDRELNEAVAGLYYTDYFVPNNFHLINSTLVALQLFDFAMHGGYSVRRLQARMNLIFNRDLKEDGINGPRTTAAINDINPELLSHQILFLRRMHLNNIIERDPTQTKFENGWNNRIDYMRRIIKQYASLD